MAQKITFATPHTVVVIVMEARELSMLLRLQWSAISVSGMTVCRVFIFTASVTLSDGQGE
jgi:hypothetical protein